MRGQSSGRTDNLLLAGSNVPPALFFTDCFTNYRKDSEGMEGTTETRDHGGEGGS